MQRAEIEAKELEALYCEKRDKLNARLAIWSLLLTLFGAFSYAGTQSGVAGYVIVCYPLLAGCIARFARHSERVLDRVKRHIYQIEKASGYVGYEHQNVSGSTNGSGAHIKALRDFAILTDAIAIIAIDVRLIIIDRLPALALLATVLGVVAIVATCVWMHDKPAHEEEQKRTTGLLRNEAAQDRPEREEAWR
jgi:hypothetical protein